MRRMTPAPLHYRIRDALPADASTIVEFNRRLALETEAKQLDLDVLSRGVERALAQPAYCRYFLAEHASPGQPIEIIGQTMITYEWSDWRNGVFWWIQSVYVRQDHRGQGIFRALYEWIANLARSTPDVCGLRLYVETHNHAALSTYSRLGMVPSGHVLYEEDWSGAAIQAM